MGRAARRGDDRAGHGRGERRPAVGRRPRVRRGAGDPVRAVHAVRQRHHARPGDARPRARQADAAWSSRCATACWRCRASTSTHHLQQIIREHNARVEGIDVDPLSAGDEEIEAAPAELALDLDERLKVGLVTLCTPGARALSRAVRAADAVAPHGGRPDGARRPAGRRRARPRRRGLPGDDPRHSRCPTRGFRLALWLQRRLGIDRLLTERLADRFEILMVQQDVLAELAAFNVQLDRRPARRRRRGSSWPR